MWRAGKSMTSMVCLDILHHDRGITELGAAQHHLQPVQQRGVAAPVGGQRLLLARRLRRLQIRHDVAAAKRIDGLLRIADQDHRGVPAERAVDHLPLDLVGVLELVDHDDRPAVAHARSRGGVVGVQRGSQSAQQVVVAQDAESPFAVFQFGQNVFREIDAGSGLRSWIRVAGPQLGCRVVDHLAGQLQRSTVLQHRIVALLTEVSQVQIVDDLGGEIVKAFQQGDVGGGVARHAERFQHQLAELVRGGDRRRVETGQRIAQPLLAECALVVAALQQVGHQLVVTDRRRIVESDYSVGDLAAHPLAELLAGRPTERDEQHLIQRRLALGEIARHQTGQRERLAGACAGLQHGGGAFGRQRAEQVEWLHQVGILSARSIGSQSRQA